MDWNFRNDQPIYSQLTQRLTEAIVSGIVTPDNLWINKHTGEITTDEILGNIFARFCIGK